MYRMDTVKKSPQLIEHGTKYFYSEWLSRYHQQQVVYYTQWTNVALASVFALVMGGWLWWKYSNRMTEEDKKHHHQTMEKYISDRIATIQKEKEKTELDLRLERAGYQHNIEPELAHSSSNLITNLPSYENEFQLVHGWKTI